MVEVYGEAAEWTVRRDGKATREPEPVPADVERCIRMRRSILKVMEERLHEEYKYGRGRRPSKSKKKGKQRQEEAADAQGPASLDLFASLLGGQPNDAAPRRRLSQLKKSQSPSKLLNTPPKLLVDNHDVIFDSRGNTIILSENDELAALGAATKSGKCFRPMYLPSPNLSMGLAEKPAPVQKTTRKGQKTAGRSKKGKNDKTTED